MHIGIDCNYGLSHNVEHNSIESVSGLPTNAHNFTGTVSAKASGKCNFYLVNHGTFHCLWSSSHSKKLPIVSLKSRARTICLHNLCEPD